MEEKKQKPDYSINWLVFWVLLVFTAGEYSLGVISTTNIAGVMFAIGFLKAGFILVHYMNVGRLFSGDEEAH